MSRVFQFSLGAVIVVVEMVLFFSGWDLAVILFDVLLDLTFGEG